MMRVFIAVFALLGLSAAGGQTMRVTGMLDRWDAWSFALDTTTPGCIAGEKPCNEEQTPPQSYTGYLPAISIPVEGYATITGASITELTLTQNREVSIQMAGGRYGKLRLSGLRWTLKDDKFRQEPGAFAKCSATASACLVNAAAIQDPAIDSPLDFDGIPNDFPIQFGATLLNRHPAFTADAGDLTAISVNVASSQPQTSPTSTIFNAATLGHFTLAVEEKEER